MAIGLERGERHAILSRLDIGRTVAGEGDEEDWPFVHLITDYVEYNVYVRSYYICIYRYIELA